MAVLMKKETTMDCSYCWGNGYIRESVENPCSRCDGMGRVVSESGPGRCPKCDGLGSVVVKKVCPVCKGTGREKP